MGQDPSSPHYLVLLLLRKIGENKEKELKIAKCRWREERVKKKVAEKQNQSEMIKGV